MPRAGALVRRNHPYRLPALRTGALATGARVVDLLAQKLYKYVTRPKSKTWGNQELKKGTKRQKVYKKTAGQAGKRWYGARSSKSAGFVKSSRRGFRRFKRRWTMANKGIQRIMEYGGISTTTYNQFIGHATCPRKEIQTLLIGVLVKRVLAMNGILCKSLKDAIDYSSGDDQWYLSYREDSDPATAEADIYYNPSAGNYTAVDVINYMIDNLPIGNLAEFTNFRFVPAGSGPLRFVKLDLRHASVGFNIKSTLKIQNRSITAEGELDSDNVDNVPLYGKSYEGGGSGCYYTHGTVGRVPFIADNYHGVIDKPGLTEDTSEPPIPHHFTNVWKAGKARLDPGEVKTSTLVWKKRIGWSAAMKHCIGDTDVAEYVKKSLGKFRMFSLEKMIDAVAGGLGIVLAWEHNLDMFACLNYKPTNPTVAYWTFDIKE